MNERICQIGLQSLSNNYQDQVLYYMPEMSSFTAFGPCSAEPFRDKPGKLEEK